MTPDILFSIQDATTVPSIPSTPYKDDVYMYDDFDFIQLHDVLPSSARDSKTAYNPKTTRLNQYSFAPK